MQEPPGFHVRQTILDEQIQTTASLVHGGPRSGRLLRMGALMPLPATCRLLILAAATATVTSAQVAPATDQSHQPLHHAHTSPKPHAAVPEQPPPPPPVPQKAPSMLDEPARPAQIQLNDGKLSVKADNSSLSGILQDISSKTGMTVDGLSRDQRIFGSYGPASPREVLSALLDGLGYNVLMVGSQDGGAPRQLLLTQRTGGLNNSGSPGTFARQNNNNTDNDDDSAQSEDSVIAPPPRPEPPQQDQQQQLPSTAPPGATPAGQQNVRTPQQMLQELQQMRRQQDQSTSPQ